jgi:hypothetical protein
MTSESANRKRFQKANDNKSNSRNNAQTRCEDKGMKVARRDQIIFDCSHTRFQVVLAAELLSGFIGSPSSSLQSQSVEQIDGE